MSTTKSANQRLIGGIPAKEYQRQNTKAYRRRMNKTRKYAGRHIPDEVKEAIRQDREHSGLGMLRLASKWGVSEWAVRKILGAPCGNQTKS